MTTSKPPDTIAADMPMVKGAYTMKVPDEVLMMKTLHEKGHAPWKIAKILGCSNHALKRYIENGFDAAPREQPQSALDTHGDFLLERFLRHDGNADVVRQELAAKLGDPGLPPYRANLIEAVPP